MEGKAARRRTVICVIIFALIFAAFAARLFDWQILQGEKYRGAALSSISYTQTSNAVRGEILDVNGVPLAVNEPCYSLTMDKLYIDGENENEVILRLIDILNDCGEQWTDVLPIKTDENGKYEFVQGEEEAVRELKSDILQISDSASAQTCMNRLTDRYGLSDITERESLRAAVSVKYNMELSGYSASTPYVFAENLDQDAAAVISELTQNISGVEITTGFVRVNRNPTLAPHIVGALGALTEEEYESLKSEGYAYNDRIGKFGIELALESSLRGTAGTKVVQKNADGSVVGVVEQTDAQPGNTVYLTLNSEIQQAANTALAENIAAAQANGKAQAESTGKSGYGEDCTAGAAVMLDLRDFSVIAASTYPTFDLSKYYSADYYSSLVNDELSPLFDRAFNGTFAPGSVYKPAVASAALQEGVITEDEKIFCSHYYRYSDITVACMGYHGSIDIRTALEKSCNFFFAELGRRLGIDTMYLYAEKFGLGVRTGVEITEASGMLAGRDSTDWYEGNTVSASIGQSDNAFTPVQLATYAATIANNGVRYRTHIVSKITDYSRENIIMENDPDSPEIAATAGVSQENLKIVQEGMRRVAVSGTASSVFANYPVDIAAKTGTAENSGSDHATFICYAPYENPEVAVAVVLEHGASSRYSMAVAKAMLDAYFGL